VVNPHLLRPTHSIREAWPSPSAADRMSQCAIRDRGIGRSSAQLERLFKSFEQADASTTRRYGGSGLGLAITKHLETMMNGTVEATSEPSVGAIFIVRLLHGLTDTFAALEDESLVDSRDVGLPWAAAPVDSSAFAPSSSKTTR
jgi:hypothetical protein